MIATWNATANWWSRVWFTPRAPQTLSVFRVACGLVASLQFIILLLQGSEWIGPDGWLSVDAGRYLIGSDVEGTGSLYRWSIFYVVPGATSIVAGFGLFASIATLAGMGARVSPFLTWLCLGMFNHRAPMLTQVHEPLLAAMLAYLIIDPGRLSWSLRPGLVSGPSRMSVNIANQLIRCHLWIWIAFSLSSMLANPIWWNGEAGWILLEQGQGWLRLSDGWQWLGQALTHFVIATQAAVLFCMVQDSCFWLGRWMIYLLVFAVLLLLGDWMYASILFAASLAVWPIQLPHRNDNDADNR